MRLRAAQRGWQHLVRVVLHPGLGLREGFGRHGAIRRAARGARRPSAYDQVRGHGGHRRDRDKAEDRQHPPHKCFCGRPAFGEYRWFAARAHPVLDDRSNVTRGVGGALDVHDLNQPQRFRRRRSSTFSDGDLPMRTAMALARRAPTPFAFRLRRRRLRRASLCISRASEAIAGV
jgi:hypothetical protein